MLKYLASAGIIAGNIIAANGISIGSEIAAKKLIKSGKSKKSKKKAKILRLLLSRSATVTSTAVLATASAKPLIDLWTSSSDDVSSESEEAPESEI